MNLKIRLMPALLMCMLHSFARAEWVLVSHDQKATYYIESAMSGKVSGRTTIWVMRDFARPQLDRSAPYMSSRDQLEVDCNALKVRRSYSGAHAQRMGSGQLLHAEYGPLSWNYAPTNTVLRRIVDIACAH